MFDHVLVPLDGSALAEEAIQAAKQLTQPEGTITLIMAIDIPRSWESDLYYPVLLEDYHKLSSDLKPQAESYLEQIASPLRADGFQVATVVAYGEPATAILEIAAERGADVIAMSTHGRSGFSRWLMGSVTDKVLNAAFCPVFVVPIKRHVPGVPSKMSTDVHIN